MDIRFIGMKEFRQNMASIAASASKKKQSIIVMRKNRPVFELRPIEPDREVYAEFLRGILEAREDVRRGRAYSAKEVGKRLGL